MNCIQRHNHVLNSAACVVAVCLIPSVAPADLPGEPGGGVQIHTNQDGLPIDPHTNQDRLPPPPSFDLFDIKDLFETFPGHEFSGILDDWRLDDGWPDGERPRLFDGVFISRDDVPAMINLLNNDVPPDMPTIVEPGAQAEQFLAEVGQLEGLQGMLYWGEGTNGDGGSVPFMPAAPIPGPGALMLLGVGAAFLRRPRSRS